MSSQSCCAWNFQHCAGEFFLAASAENQALSGWILPCVLRIVIDDKKAIFQIYYCYFGGVVGSFGSRLQHARRCRAFRQGYVLSGGIG